MSDNSSNNKRIAQNTLFLYLRMGISMIVQLYTSRIVLQCLGVSDYGIYNVVASFVIAFTYISGPLGTAMQRFLNFELGKKEKGDPRLIFSMSIIVYIILSILFFCVVEITGLWFINSKMNLPTERYDAAVIVFHLSTMSVVFNLLKTPFESLIIAKEKMSFYAYISIFDVVLKLLNAFSLSVLLCFDRLCLYGFNLLLISIVIMLSSLFYCYTNFKDIKPSKLWDKNIFKELLSFSGWSLFGSIASMTSNQGLNLVLNVFHGVVVNAAMGIAGQVSSAVNQFATNFQIAFRPQIVKSYAAGDYSYLHKLICSTSKFSFVLLFAITFPLCLNIDYILNIWLGDVPMYASQFCIFMIIYALLESLSAPMWMAVQATGRIRNYQLTISSAMFLNIILSYLFLKLGYAPIIVLVIKCMLDLLYIAIRLLYVKKLVSFSIRIYVKEVLMPVIFTMTLPVLIVFEILRYVKLEGAVLLIVSSIIFLLAYIIAVYLIGLNKSEKSMVKKIISKLKR